MSAKLTHEEFILRFQEKNNHDISILGVYDGLNKHIRVRCNTHNMEYDAFPGVLLSGSGCRLCGRETNSELRLVTHDDFMNRLKLKNQHILDCDIEVIGEFVHFDSRIMCRCTCCEHVWSPSAYSLWNGSGCPECFRNNFVSPKKIAHDEFVSKLSLVHPDFIVLDKYDGTSKKIRFQCKHGHVWPATPYSVLNGNGCPYCANKKVWVGFNDLWTTRPDIAVLLKNPDDGYKYTCYSGKKIEFVCPICGHSENKIISNVSKRGIRCQRCSDGVSYPNKFGRAFLDQLNIVNHICEYNPEWADLYRYDNYFECNDKQYMLEMDGGFHYKDNSLSKQSLEEIQVIDAIKTKLANEHNIHVIRVNCERSDCDYIKNNILSSELNCIFDLSHIDWVLCDQRAQKSLVKEACNLYTNETHDLNEIANRLHVAKKTVRRYLRNGKKFDWCDYNF